MSTLIDPNFSEYTSYKINPINNTYHSIGLDLSIDTENNSLMGGCWTEYVGAVATDELLMVVYPTPLKLSNPADFSWGCSTDLTPLTCNMLNMI